MFFFEKKVGKDLLVKSPFRKSGLALSLSLVCSGSLWLTWADLEKSAAIRGLKCQQRREKSEFGGDGEYEGVSG